MAAVVVVGGGVMGFCTAVRLLESGCTDDVTIVAAKLHGIPSRSSPAVFRPDWLGDTDPARVVKWALDTREHLCRLHREIGSSSGITSIVHAEVYRTAGNQGSNDPGQILPKVVDGFRALTQKEIATHLPGADGGWHYSTFMIEGSRYLPWLADRAEALGARLVVKKVCGRPGTLAFCESAVAIAERPWCTVVVNATGENGGPECTPVRGQLVLVDAPFIKLALGEYNPKDRSRPTYIYPRRDHVVLGSTYLVGDGNREVRDETTADIISRCAEFVPELRNARIISEVVCLRPGRKAGIRLDAERVGSGAFTIVSCFGHGGAGMSLGWGCAGEVVEHVGAAFRRTELQRICTCRAAIDIQEGSGCVQWASRVPNAPLQKSEIHSRL